ncbi:MAG: hypothetical protein KKH52_00960 [Nanoarchaeota archaeon]|nr:hypothetical protein [Nanoarchaeota archaeon]MBU1622933.1 hypothetical protein [Nanoarchaeota archaeon]MBU1973946.1 hypothetical protein [Nanoarchaeota archaeon]
MNKQIWPSIMAKSQQELNKDLNKLKGVAKTLHLDIVDGKFAHNKTLQFPFKLKNNFNYTVHLMIKNPEKWIKKNIKKNYLFIPHFEEIKHKEEHLQFIKKNKKKVAFALLPKTKVKTIKPYLNKINYILILTVQPGFYGSKFLKKPLQKIKQIKKLNPQIKIIVDGGLNPKTIKKAQAADYFVSGSYTTKAEHPQQRIKLLKQALS